METQRGAFDPEPHLGFHPAVTSTSHLVWRQYGFRGNAVTKSDQTSAGRLRQRSLGRSWLEPPFSRCDIGSLKMKVTVKKHQ
ncbi:hypothetical protein Hanom_Chr12g01176671 [Helianthus anomalus]